ncbi:MAG: phosphodiester glycosidase family protein [Ignavibacteriae bacterium]|nr:phosphodiester glycosidase family protein [Ignavibacteriota bacterium]
MKTCILLLLALTLSANAQPITWTEQSMSALPAGVKLWRGERVSPALMAWYLKVNMNDTTIAIRPYVTTASGGVEGIVPMVQRFHAYAGINGGFFSGSTSLSTVVYPNEVKAQNPSSLVRNSVTYPVTRSMFSVTNSRQMRVNWIYHFGSRVQDIYAFASPTPNSPGSPAPVPQQANGTPYANVLAGIGGAPTLVKGGAANVTYDQEVMFGSGVGLDVQEPRTAVGYTSNRYAILLVADGRSAQSSGVTLPELAQIMIDLGCVEAMNLDGGGSTQMAVGDSLINLPVGSTYQRPVPTMLAVVRAESLQAPRTPVFEKNIDTGDQGATLVSPTNGWFASANPGYWGTTPAQLHPIGNGNSYARFRVGTAVNAFYEVYGWWVASSNRATNVPFVIRHADGQDTVRVNQAQNGSQWVRIGGTYRFNNDTSLAIYVSNAATTNSYIVADAVRVISYDPATASVRPIADASASGFRLEQNYPNPFNPITNIRFTIQTLTVEVPTNSVGTQSGSQFTILKVFDIMGRELTTLVQQPLEPGTYETTFDASALSSGLYFYRLQAGRFSETKKLVVVR